MSNTLATLLTGRGRGAVATILVDGTNAIAFVLKHFQSVSSPLRDLQTNKVYFGTWNWESYSEELVVCRVEEHRVEIHCHGGRIASKLILDSLAASGAIKTSSSQWVGKTDSNRFARESLELVPSARTERAAAILLDQTRNAMTRALKLIQNHVDLDNLDAATRAIESMLAFSALGQRLVRPFSVVLYGPPNAGKSSLVNSIVGYERAIVYDQPGTTRDLVSAETAIDGWAIELTDTAGIRNTVDRIEQAGIQQAQDKLASADLVLLVHDMSTTANSDNLKHNDNIPALSVGTKSDLAPKDLRLGANFDVTTCATTGLGVEQLNERIIQSLVPELPAPGAAVPTTPWQVDQLEQIQRLLKTGKLKVVRQRLQELLNC